MFGSIQLKCLWVILTFHQDSRSTRESDLINVPSTGISSEASDESDVPDDADGTLSL